MCLRERIKQIQETGGKRVACRTHFVPILLIHGLADTNIAFQQSERIRAHDPAKMVLWEAPLAGHCGAVNAAAQEFNTGVLGWFTSHDRGTVNTPLRPS